MSTIAAKPLSQYPWFIRLFFWKQKRTYGRILDPGLLWGRSPWVFAAVALFSGALDRKSSPIAPALRSLVTVRVSQINHCAFCVSLIHISEPTRLGMISYAVFCLKKK